MDRIVNELVDIVCEFGSVANGNPTVADAQKAQMRLQLRERELVRKYGRDVVRSAIVFLSAKYSGQGEQMCASMRD